MFRKGIGIILALLSLFLSGCSVDGPISEIDADGKLRLELVLPKSRYRENEAITCHAVLTYVGEKDTFTFLAGEPVVMFAIGGGEYFNGDYDLVQKEAYYPQKIEKNQPIEYPFQKYIGVHLGSVEKAVRFWKEFLAQEDLILAPGKYEIIASINYGLSPEDLPHYTANDLSSGNRLTVRHKIRVERN